MFGATGCAHKDGSSCPRTVTSDVVTTTGPGQMLVALNVPADYPLPATFTLDGTTKPDFRPSPTYTSELQRLRPPSAGPRWAGYICDVHSFTPGASASLTLTFDRPLPADGSPRAGMISFNAMVGPARSRG